VQGASGPKLLTMYITGSLPLKRRKKLPGQKGLSWPNRDFGDADRPAP